jgi:uncharacterized membrane protein
MLIAGFVPLGILMGPIMCGIYLTLFRHMRGGKIEFSMLFKGFDYFVESLIATLLYFIPILLLILPFYGAMVSAIFFFSRHSHAGGQPSAGAMALFGLGFFLFALVIAGASFVVAVMFTFAYPLIVDRKLSGIEALKLSAKAGLANFWGLVGLLLLNAVMAIAGMLLCYFGVFLVLPVNFAGHAMAYRQVFGLGAEQPAVPPPVTQ